MCSANPVLVINSDTLDSQTVEAVHIVRGETHCGNYVGYHTSESSAILSIIPQHSSAFLSIPQHSSAFLSKVGRFGRFGTDLTRLVPLSASRRPQARPRPFSERERLLQETKSTLHPYKVSQRHQSTPDFTSKHVQASFQNPGFGQNPSSFPVQTQFSPVHLPLLAVKMARF